MLRKLGGHLRVSRPFERQLHCNLQHVLAEQHHPRSAIRLLQVSTSRQRCAAIKYPNIVQPEEATLERVFTRAVLAVHPPGEVQQKLLERALQPVNIASAATHLLKPVREDGGPGMHRRVNVTEIPLVRRKLSIWVQVASLEH